MMAALLLIPETVSAGEHLVGLDSGKASDKQTEAQTGKETEKEEGKASLNGWKVAIDPGHQGSWVDMSAQEPIAPGAAETKAKATTGTQSPYTGYCEYELNLEVSLLVRQELEKRGYEVVMTREDHDTAISNSERAQLAAEEGADILVRVHANGSDDHSVNGALTMVPSQQNLYIGNLYEECYTLGESILTSYCEATGFANLGVQYYDNMSGINWSTIPVTILEMGFMSNEAEDAAMEDEKFWPMMAKGIADGIDDYFDQQAAAAVPADISQTMNELQDSLYVFLSEHVKEGENWSVAVEDISTGKGIRIQDQQMQAASLIKLFIMGKVYEEYESLLKTYSGEDLDRLLYDMITVSDNDAANTLVGYLGDGDSAAGMEAVNEFCRENGFENTVMGRLLLAPADHGDNLTSVGDCTAFLRMAQSGEFPEGEKMMDLLKQQQRTHKIPSGIPENVTVANKTGELGDVENDAAVVFADSPYILCVMSENLQDVGSAQACIAQISSQVYSILG